MPYRWTTPPGDTPQEMQLWPHESLPARGMAAFVLGTFTLALVPSFAVLGSPLLWGLLPFVLLAIWGLYFALQRNHKARQITETLTLGAKDLTLIRIDPDGATRRWACNRYWVSVQHYDDEGPVPHYITLRGSGREVEIGAFLSEDERVTLYDDLTRALRAA